MKNLLLLVMAFAITCLAVPKPMESIENYNVLMVHGAYGSDKGIENCSNETSEAVKENYYLTTNENGANIGYYQDGGRLTRWLESTVFEDTTKYDSLNPFSGYQRSQGLPYIYSWRAFTNPANSSINNAHELGDRNWKGCGHRRALVEEAQEVKAVYDTLGGQEALQIIRKNPNLYRQLASRYILIGHSIGGIASREWIQNSDYYHGDVDKVITLDSPHEGTGALNAQMRLKKAFTHAQFTAIAAERLAAMIVTIAFVKAPLIKSIGISYLAISAVVPFLTPVIEKSLEGDMLENYKLDDSLVDYLDPSKSGVGHIDQLLEIAPTDSQPMFRLLGGKKSMTFTDIDSDYSWNKGLGFIVPSADIIGIGNVWHHFSFDYDKVSFGNALTGAVLGYANIPVWDDGTSLVSVSSGMAENTKSLNDPMADVKREQFFAAVNVNEMSDKAEGILIATTALATASLVAGTALAFFGGETARMAGEIAILSSGVLTLAKLYETFDFSGGFADLGKSHQIPLYKKFMDTLYVRNPNTFSSFDSAGNSLLEEYTPYLMEDFLYEKPFVNLALKDSRTMDSLSKISNDARDNSTLNRNCFYGADADENQLCEIGLYGKDSTGFVPLNSGVYSNYAKTPLKFKSSTDWDKMGIKLDRWERVPGLTPEGKEKSDYVPIRHVERYNVPAITVDDWIEKYSFVVDDLMPHRLRQIRMEFNYQEEIAWECDITKDPNVENACVVYKRTSGEQWHLAGSVGKNGYVPHPVKKNGLFEFEPRKYGYKNLLAIQKDNQNTVTISTVNKIGLSNT